jgi:hypothetical protein
MALYRSNQQSNKIKKNIYSSYDCFTTTAKKQNYILQTKWLFKNVVQVQQY